MTTTYLTDLQERVLYVKDNITSITVKVIEGNEELMQKIVQLNKDQLYEQGEDSKHGKLAAYRSLYYADMKANLRGGQELTDLFLTGDFQDGFYLYFDGDNYGITSNDFKTSKLIEKYGEFIFGLTDENRATVYFMIQPILQPVVMDYLRYGETQ